jgi:hypothetical protein
VIRINGLPGGIADGRWAITLAGTSQELRKLERAIAPVRGIRHRHFDGHRTPCLSPTATISLVSIDNVRAMSV